VRRGVSREGDQAGAGFDVMTNRTARWEGGLSVITR
jgi:hypothetical protein